MGEQSRRARFLPGAVTLGVGLVALAIYVATASRTITWWEGSRYPLTACLLGIAAPPGSLLLTLLGWVVSRIPLFFPVAFRLNLFAALIAAATVALVTALSIRLATPQGRQPAPPEIAAGAITGLALALSLSVWSHAVQFTPYILTALFTALILAAALSWWDLADSSDARGRLFLLFLLIGLDFSVHRTNALLLPAALLWITLRQPRDWGQPGRWGAIAAGLGLGLSFHLLLIPIALQHPPFEQGEPSNLARLWSYVSLQQFGGGFLLQVLPRKADFLHVQLADYARFLRQSVLPDAAWPPLTILPGFLVALGWLADLRANPRRALGLLGFVLCASLGAVVYFNLPAHYFRAMDRHYLPSLVLLVPWMAAGIAALLRLAPRGFRPGFTGALAILLLQIPWSAWHANHDVCDLSRVRFAETYSRDVLEPLPPGTILLTNGDNDSFPLWYLQYVEHVRPDVLVVNLPATNMATYVAQLRRSDPRLAGLESIADRPGYVDRGDSSMVTTRGPAGADSLTLQLPRVLIGQDVVVLSLLRLALPERPVRVACTVAPYNVPWLWPYLRPDGLTYRVAPTTDPEAWDVAEVGRRLFDVVRYTDVADTTIRMDPDSRGICANYFAALFTLANAQLERGNPEACLATLRFAAAHTPPARLGLDERMLDDLRARAEARVRAREPARN